MAETYGIYDYRSLPVQTVATLSAGLRNNSRIKCRLNGTPIYDIGTLIGYVYDKLNDVLLFLGAYDKTPESMVSKITGAPDERKKKYNPIRSFASPEDFERALSRFS